MLSLAGAIGIAVVETGLYLIYAQRVLTPPSQSKKESLKKSKNT